MSTQANTGGRTSRPASIGLRRAYREELRELHLALHEGGPQLLALLVQFVLLGFQLHIAIINANIDMRVKRDEHFEVDINDRN